MKVLILCLIAFAGLSKIVESVALHCDFKENIMYGYCCEAKGLKITSKDDRTITEVTGEHLEGKTNSDVVYFSAFYNVLELFPLGLATFFDNLESVEVDDAQLIEIHSSDLQQFGGKLIRLDFGSNAIESLEADLFQFNPNLMSLNIGANRITHIEEGTFRGLDKLEIFSFNGGNPCINEPEIEYTTNAELIAKN